MPTIEAHVVTAPRQDSDSPDGPKTKICLDSTQKEDGMIVVSQEFWSEEEVDPAIDLIIRRLTQELKGAGKKAKKQFKK
ncbi:MAG: hypothetical protein K9K64_10010 [Desulfohalobiaceae bacterium]|nr:hypothetical protein [Desulfohalobiaceae bacterium]